MRRFLLLAPLLFAVGCGGGSPTATTTPHPPSTRPTATAPAPAFRATRAVAAYTSWRLPYPISREAVMPSGSPGAVVLAGGMLLGDTSSSRAIRVVLAGGRSSALPALGVPVHDVAAGPYAGHPAVFGGGNATEQSVVQALIGGHWKSVANLPTTRSDLSVVSVSGRTLVIGGYDGVNVPRAILTVGSDGRFHPVGELVNGVRYAATAVLNGNVYVFGGELNHQELGAVQRFDVSAGKAAVVAHLPRALGHAVAVTVGGRVLLLGGRTDPDTQTAAMWWFDPATRRFTPAGRLPAATSDSAVVVLGKRVWLLGGESPSVTDRVIEIRVS